jgi:DNA-directed RNA polymerase specialized sigma24 family protein
MTDEAELSREEELLGQFAELGPAIGDLLKRFEVPVSAAEELLQTVLQQALAHHDVIREPGAWLLGRLRSLCIAHGGRRWQGGQRPPRRDRAGASLVAARFLCFESGHGSRGARNRRRRVRTRDRGEP